MEWKSTLFRLHCFCYFRESGCFRCLLLIKRHKNIIQYKESEYRVDLSIDWFPFPFTILLRLLFTIRVGTLPKINPDLFAFDATPLVAARLWNFWQRFRSNDALDPTPRSPCLHVFPACDNAMHKTHLLCTLPVPFAKITAAVPDKKRVFCPWWLPVMDDRLTSHDTIIPWVLTTYPFPA